ncbi:MAG: hypothetical protein IJ297_02010 [Clostridia bacterium]|nr:hypothetical protein [Clostridia bacterium]
MKWHLKIFMVAMLVLSVINLTGCSPSVKSANEVFNDMKTNAEFAEEYYEFEIVDAEIEKRQTDIDSKTDIVYANIYLKNTDGSIEGCVYTIITYGLYDKGWILDTWTLNEDKGSAQFTPITGLNLTEEDILNILNNNYTGEKTNIILNSNEFLLEENITEYYVSFTERHKYVTYQRETIIYTYFNKITGLWDEPIAETMNMTEEWDISGEYSQDLTIPYKVPQDYMVLCNSDIFGTTEIQFDKLYDLSNMTFKKSLPKTVRDYFARERIENNECRIVFKGDYANANKFRYIAATYHYGAFGDGIYIGPDDIALCTYDLSDSKQVFMVELDKVVRKK